jgi:hypothetical protein
MSKKHLKRIHKLNRKYLTRRKKVTGKHTAKNCSTVDACCPSLQEQNNFEIS